MEDRREKGLSAFEELDQAFHGRDDVRFCMPRDHEVTSQEPGVGHPDFVGLAVAAAVCW